MLPFNKLALWTLVIGKVRFLPSNVTQSVVLLRQVVCLSVHLAMMLRYRDHIDWNCLKIIRKQNSQCGVLALCWPQHHWSTHRGTSQKFGWNGVWKKWLLAHKTSSISETRPRLLNTNRKAYMHFQISIGARINDLGWPLSLCTLFHSVVFSICF